MVQLEKAGIPTATILSDGFQDAAKASAKAFGMKSTPFTVVPNVYNNVTVQEAIEQTDPIVDEIITLLTTQEHEDETNNAVLTSTQNIYESFEAVDQFNALAKFNNVFLSSSFPN